MRSAANGGCIATPEIYIYMNKPPSVQWIRGLRGSRCIQSPFSGAWLAG